jgi:hypothetical protein
MTITTLEQRKIATEVVGNVVSGGGIRGGLLRWRKWAGKVEYPGRVSPRYSPGGQRIGAAWANEGKIARLSRALLGLSVAEEAAAAGGVAASAAVLWPVAIAAAVIALIGFLVILYFKWKAFHDLIDRTWKWIKRNAMPLAVMLTQAFGPIGIAVAGLTLMVRQFHRLKTVLKEIIDLWHKLPAFLRQPLSKTLHLGAAGGPAGSFAGKVGRFAIGDPFAGMRGYKPGESFPHWLGQHALHMIPGYGIGSRIAGLFQMGGTVPGPVG